MAIVLRLDHLLDTGKFKDQVELARTAGITRARVMQILNLTNLARDIQRAILDLEPSMDQLPSLREGEVRQIAITMNWDKQRQSWKRLLKRNRKCGPTELRLTLPCEPKLSCPAAILRSWLRLLISDDQPVG